MISYLVKIRPIEIVLYRAELCIQNLFEKNLVGE